MAVDTMQTYLGMHRRDVVPPETPEPPKPPVMYKDRNKKEPEPSGVQTTRWLLENSLTRRLAVAEAKVFTLGAEAARLRRAQHLSVAAAAAGTARASEAAHVVHAASVARAEEEQAQAKAEREAALAKQLEVVRRKLNFPFPLTLQLKPEAVCRKRSGGRICMRWRQLTRPRRRRSTRCGKGHDRLEAALQNSSGWRMSRSGATAAAGIGRERESQEQRGYWRGLGWSCGRGSGGGRRPRRLSLGMVGGRRWNSRSGCRRWRRQSEEGEGC